MKLSTRILLAFSLIIALSLADSYTNYLLSQKVKRNSEYLSRSEAIIRNSNRTHKAIIEMQSAFRGYLLTDDVTFLDTYFKGKKSVPILMKEQHKLTVGNRAQTKLIDSIEAIHTQWLNYSSSLIESRKNIKTSPISEQEYLTLFEGKLKKQVGKKMNDEISSLFAVFDRAEYLSRKQHSAMLSESIENTRTLSLLFLGATIIVGVISTAYIVTTISKRIASMVRLADNITKGRFSSVADPGHDELTALSTSLNIMSERLNRNISELETRNAELNKFAYVVSHDLKAPIRGVHNVITWIEEDFAHEMSPDLRKYLHIIPQRTKRMEALINGLLDYARISKKTEPEEVDTEALIHDVADSIVPRSFSVSIGPMPTLVAERLKLEQVFANLISNGVKYTRRDDGKITITCRELPFFYEFSVKDNGPGIDPQYHTKIFEIFQTLREKDEKESTGVGLAIVKKIIDEQQGSIRVVSEPGKGSDFIFTWKKHDHEKT